MAVAGLRRVELVDSDAVRIDRIFHYMDNQVGSIVRGVAINRQADAGGRAALTVVFFPLNCYS